MDVKSVPPTAWLGITLAAGVVYLVWHTYARDDEDTDWSMSKELGHPPTEAGMAATRAPYARRHTTGRLMQCGAAFRARWYPDSLVADLDSVIGEC